MTDPPPTDLAAWIVDHAREDVERGVPLPPWLTAYVRDLLNPPMTAHGHENAPPEKMITAAQMAERTGYSVRTIRRRCQTGQLPAVRIGRDWLIREHDGREQDHTPDPRRDQGGDPRR